MITERIQTALSEQADEKYRRFQAKLMPGVEIERIIGVRTPILRKMAKDWAKDPEIGEFLAVLPHRYYDEYNLHGFIISESRDYDWAVSHVDALLPYVDNWATCDLLSPKAFRKNRDRLPADINRWLSSDRTYTIRFGVEMLMSHYLDEDFDPQFLARVAEIRSEEYYVNMMLAWYYATALTKQWDAALPYITDRRLAPWVHNKTIQKAIESYRITEDQKAFLRTLRI